LELSIHDARPLELGLLAEVFTKLDVRVKALDLLEQFTTPGILNDDTKILVNCAQHLDRDDLLLRICRELRETGEQDDEMRRLELGLLNRYAPEQGFALADEFIQRSTSKAYFVAFKNFLSVRLNPREELCLDVLKLPGPADLSPREAYLVVYPYVVIGLYDRALQFLYAQLRLYREDEQSNGQYVFFFLVHGDKTSLCRPPVNIEPGCAVLLDIDGDTQQWIVIENDNPLPSRGEFSESSKTAQRLIGREVDEVIEIPGGLVQPEKTTIREIQTKYVRAFQDCIQHFNKRFPETSFIQQMCLGSGDNFDPTPVIESLKQRRASVEDCIAFYKNNPISLQSFASQLGFSELEAVKLLRLHPNGMVRCCQTTPGEFNQAVSKGVVGGVIVLDISAIVTLTLVYGWRSLDPNRRYVVSWSTKKLVEQWLSNTNAEHVHESGHAWVTEDGRLRYQETTEEHRSERRLEIENIKNMIDTHCDCQSSEAVAAIPPETRKLYEQVAGVHNVESMSLAKDLNALLWTDDVVLSFIAKADFEVTSMWTQLGLRCFVDARHLTIDDFELVTAKLASWNYSAIIWKPATIIKAGEHASWTPQQPPFKQCIELIANAGLTLPEKSRFSLEFLMLLRRSSCPALKQTAVILAILKAIGNRNVVLWMFGRLDQVFALDPESADFLRHNLKYWLERHLR